MLKVFFKDGAVRDYVSIRSFFSVVRDVDSHEFDNARCVGSEAGISFDCDIDDLGVVISKLKTRNSVREKIKGVVGDAESILGTASDAVQLVMCELAECGDLLESAETMNDVNAVGTRLKSVFGRLLSDDVQLTVGIKGKESIVEDVAVRSTAVSNVLLSVVNE